MSPEGRTLCPDPHVDETLADLNPDAECDETLSVSDVEALRALGWRLNYKEAYRPPAVQSEDTVEIELTSGVPMEVYKCV